MGAVTIKFGTPGPGFAYDPPCIKIKAGTMVTWEGDFGLHPLEPGTVDAGVVTPDPSSPIKATTAGMSATFALTPAGTYGFYCGLHQFAGAAFVQ
jgi:plastocyanin